MKYSFSGRSPRATMKDVSALAGVSQATVSNYFNRPESVSPKKSLAIRAAIDDLGYVRDESARLLRTGENRTVGAITMEMDNSQAVRMNTKLESLCLQHGFGLLTANSRGNVDREKQYLRIFESQRVTGIVIAPSFLVESTLHEVRKRGTALVVDGRTNVPGLRWVAFDEEIGGYLATRHLIDVGCRRIAFVGGALSVWQINQRLQGASRAAAESPDVSLEIIATDERTIDDGVKVGRMLLERPKHQLPDGIFAGNDSLAIGLMQSLVIDGDITIPEQISLVGYDDSPYAPVSFIPLSSVRTAPDVVTRELFYHLMADAAELAGKPLISSELELPKKRHTSLVPELIIRRSSDRR